MVELQHALAVETGDTTLDEENIPEEELLLSVCNGLVTYEKEGGFLALVHYTFQQYLEQKAESLFPEAQVDIVRTCLTYLSFDEFEQGPCQKDHDFMVRLERWPLLNYAVPAWGQHARRGAEGACRDLIVSFLSQGAKMSASIQVLWVRESTGFKMGSNYHTRHFPSDVSAIWLASFYGLESTVCHILPSQRENLDRKTTWGETALHRASGSKRVRILAMLLDQGTDVSAKDRLGNTPLHRAAFLWTDTIFGSRKFTAESTENRLWTKERLSLSDMSLKVAQSLLDYGADVNAINQRRETALHMSVKKRQSSLTRLFLARGADITMKDQFQISPLSRASDSGYKEIARLLLNHDLQRQIQCGILDDATWRAAFEDHVPLLKMLLAKSPKHPQPDPEGRSLLHISAHGGGLKCLQYLENRGFDLRALDKQKRTCLHNAAAGLRTRSGAVLEYLLKQGLDPSQSDVDGWTPLLWAAKAGNTTNTQILLDAGAGSVYQDGREWIPFAIATYHENYRAAAILRPSNGPLPQIFQTIQSSISLRHMNVLCDSCDLVSCRSLNYFYAE